MIRKFVCGAGALGASMFAATAAWAQEAAAAAHRREHVKAGSQVSHHQSALGGDTLLLGHEVHVERFTVDLPLARTGTQEDASDRRFAPPRSVILNQICHSFL